MSAPSCYRIPVIFSRLFSVRYQCGHYHKLKRRFAGSAYRNETSNQNSSENRDPGPLFLEPRVQQILRKVTGMDLERIFEEIPAVPRPPKYELLTQQQLQKLQEKTIEKAKMKLRMPPVMKGRTDEEKILSDDPEIYGFDTSNYVFTDITYGLSNRDRLVVVREPEGRLRSATWKERDYALHTFFPFPGRMMNMPRMFEEEMLETVLGEGRYIYVLNRASVQFEPDDHEYIRVTNRTYEHIAKYGQFDALRSTRYFGGMTFYLAFYKNIDKLLVDMMQKDLLSDAADVVRLYHILHPDSASALNQHPEQDDSQLVQSFAKLDAKEGALIELSLQSYNDARIQQTSAATT